MYEMTIDNGNPRHIAIIMDGNGRWAEKKKMPRIFGHRAGVKAVRNIVEFCVKERIEVLSLFAFSSENWRRPKKEVDLLMDLFMGSLQNEVDQLDKNNIRLLIIGDKAAFADGLQQKIKEAELQTQNNTGLTLVIAANYGGRWDMAQATKQIVEKVSTGALSVQDVTQDCIEQHLSTAGLPDPDLFIRSGGEQRVSNFLLWQLAYTEFYFTDALWPDFDQQLMLLAVDSFRHRQRRFGQTGDQVVHSFQS
jgi:undecaprenyl diphosphate synthase